VRRYTGASARASVIEQHTGDSAFYNLLDDCDKIAAQNWSTKRAKWPEGRKAASAEKTGGGVSLPL